MNSTVNTPNLDGFNKSLDELLHFADTLKLREKELEQQHQLELEKQKVEYDLQLQIEKRRIEQLQEIRRTLTEQVERSTQQHIDLEHKYTVLLTKYNCCLEESKQIKEQHNEKKLRIEELEKIVRILSNDKTKLDNEIKQLKQDNQILSDKIKETPSIPPPTSSPPPSSSQQRVPAEFIQLVEKAVAENLQLKDSLSEREKEIQKLNEQLNKINNEDPQIIEQSLLQSIDKLKNDFGFMYENQFNFFLQKIDLLKQEQRDNIASLYKH